MRTTSKLLALAMTAALQPAFADVVLLDFENVTTVGKLTNQYASQGITFKDDAWGVTSNQNNCNGLTLFSRTGSCAGLLLAVNPTQTAGTGSTNFTIDVDGGFITEFAFIYGVRAFSNVSIKIYDGLDGQGTLLQTLTGLTGSACNTGVLRFCDGSWYNGSVAFEGVGHSIVISGIDQRLMLDDLKFTTPASGPQVPEPASAALVLGALGALGWTRRRTARR